MHLAIKFSDFASTITGAPLLGEHTDEVLAELGYDADQIAAMHDNGVLHSAHTAELTASEE
jgi:formyl-CoA transferase